MGALEVLVVEDEPLVRLTLAEILNEAGYGVLEAINADQALGLLESCPEIALLLADISLPGAMDGVTLADEAARLWPDMPILFTSGLAETVVGSRIKGRPFLAKPYRASDVVDAVADLLTVHA